MARIGMDPHDGHRSAFRRPDREERGDLPLNRFVFERAAYEAVSSAPVVPARGPPGSPPAGLGV
ncbi:hypothetical protein SAMN04487983_10492 [Streptomyces sp. yr375]|uniref:hypothetical protein n=1 Tax=Streptomyces sp. yr375 TaxID=1761906 RepID=UPI0008B5ADEE|nr:hypothetical protein [Streptomyces sp. yr375]SES40038.1 hypothetical protein SAMN04487983_10492 [Streptomyces sp. yr375]